MLALTSTSTSQNQPLRVLQKATGLSALSGTAGLARLRQHLQDLAQGHQGLALLIDDAHWLDVATQETLKLLLDPWEGPPLVVVFAVHQTQGLAEFQQVAARCLTLKVSPFSRTAVQVWMRNTLRWEPPEAFLDWLYTHTHGNPKRLQQVLDFLKHQGVLSEAGQGWHLATGFAYTMLPATAGGSQSAELPIPPTLYFGRHLEISDLEHIFKTRRLVTLLGPGGIGKTRLALEAGDALSGKFPDGVFFVPLETVRSDDLLPITIARALHLSDSRWDATEQLKQHLRSRQVLLILDNFEHMVEASPLIQVLLSSAPRLKVLVTSRQTLDLSGEQVYPVAPLGLPDPDELPDVSEVHQYSAVALFLDRVMAADPDFELTREVLPEVLEICRMLDGLPLALEIAAASLRRFTLSELKLALQQSKLTGDLQGKRDLSVRQRTLRNTIRWSVDLLSAAEQQVFFKLGVFVGGWTFEALQATVPSPAGHLSTVLHSLQDKSLIRQVSSGGEKRYMMLETIREYALETLQDLPEKDTVVEAHARHFLNFLEQAAPELTRAEQHLWRQKIHSEVPNLRQMMQHFRDHPQPVHLLQAVTWLWKFWQNRGHHTEGRTWIRRARGLEWWPWIRPGPPQTCERSNTLWPMH